MKFKILFFLLFCVIVFLFWPKSTNQVVLPSDKQITQSIVHGVESRFIYLDDYYSDAPADLNIFSKAKAKVITGYDSFTENKAKLFRCGLLVMRYGMRKKQLSASDFAVVKKFIDNGGRVLLACPAWVYESYEKKKIKDLSFYKIAKEFGLILTSEYATAPDNMEGVFSSIKIENGTPVLQGKDGKIVAAKSEKGKGKIFLWGQNNLFQLGLGDIVLKALNWLWQN